MGTRRSCQKGDSDRRLYGHQSPREKDDCQLVTRTPHACSRTRTISIYPSL